MQKEQNRKQHINHSNSIKIQQKVFINDDIAIIYLMLYCSFEEGLILTVYVLCDRIFMALDRASSTIDHLPKKRDPMLFVVNKKNFFLPAGVERSHPMESSPRDLARRSRLAFIFVQFFILWEATLYSPCAVCQGR